MIHTVMATPKNPNFNGNTYGTYLTVDTDGQYQYAMNPSIITHTDTREEEIFNELEKIKKKLSTTISLVHNCANCGASLEIEENHPVIHCKYCGSSYLVGTALTYSHY